MEYNPAALVPMVTLAAAFMAGAIAALTLIVNKENKISEFRQAWIDGLREDLANFFSASRTCTRAIQESRLEFKNPMPIDEATTARLRHQVAECSYRIKLRLNEIKKPHIKLESLMTESSTFVSEYFSGTTDDVDKVLSGIEIAAKQAREVLKAEWERVKKGEFAYRAARWLALALIVIAALSIWIIASSNLKGTPSVSMSEPVAGHTPAAAATTPSPPHLAPPPSVSQSK
ncbi:MULTISPECIES: hypothetical protein [unclassified Polaromonas]|jgi:hypothetical protein|uniref:hypothetical protein n=1 Tax=unclassified Polaromonas TaxID=2638319 RepID=UPI000BD3940A|nr:MULTISPECIES: hypothetical protein [unclassified Polaromonas]OYY34513.1 MAG: hypothetical protein B7Y60_15620 [Polaromonas sp. 35-63-35]OYZ18840.1 MAG: hypothetical protein B7Y28_14455 [Polaromonas sp. 16-63-31]OYZ78925.1 MAG: hypothetical protein B7Y09_11670 [Polaromonas sp. 24-63-21]OZA86897.1 MAG: hypothetical protein B7X65_15660 [Polaromonas sp. 39-63-25]HQR97496.1 hypothetical protein [Polaromonas sp.]